MAKHVDISIPGYVEKLLHRWQHIPKKEDQPFRHNVPQYGTKIQLTEEEDSSPPLSKEGIKKTMQIVGALLFYARTVDPTILIALSDLASAQTKAMQETKKATDKLLDYVGTHPNAAIRYKPSDMELNIHSDASYVSAPQVRSRVGGHFFLGNKSTSEEPDIHNGSVLSVAAILKNVVSSAAEAEVRIMYVNAREGEVLRTTLKEMGWEQTNPTPIVTNNSTAQGIVNDTL